MATGRDTDAGTALVEPIRLREGPDPAPAPGLNHVVAPPPTPIITAAAGPIQLSGPKPSGSALLPLALLRHLLEAITTTPLPSLKVALPALRILALALTAGFILRLTGATLQAINDLPLLGGLLELVGLVSLLQFLSRNALRQSKRAELLRRIELIRKELLG